jgi:hypothetical protein
MEEARTTAAELTMAPSLLEIPMGALTQTWWEPLQRFSTRIDMYINTAYRTQLAVYHDRNPNLLLGLTLCYNALFAVTALCTSIWVAAPFGGSRRGSETGISKLETEAT